MSAQEASRIAQAVQRMRHSRRALRIALPTAAALGAGAAMAVGAIPANDGTITGCYAHKPGEDFPETVVVDGVTEAPGTLRVIDPSQKPAIAGNPNYEGACQSGESTVTWNQKVGPQGLPGTPGVNGTNGVNGVPGANGAPGVQGPAGESGGETTFGLHNKAGLTFLKLDGIAGATNDKHHKDDIELNSFSFGVSNSGAHSSGGGGGAGKTIESFTILKSIDKASPLLLKASATGKHIKFAELIFAHRGKDSNQDFLSIKLSDVLVSSYQSGGSGKGLPQEQISFVFQKMQETFIGPTGKKEGTVVVDFSNNKA